MRSKDQGIPHRLLILLIIQGLICLVILGRSVQLQVFPNKRLDELTKRQYIKTIRLVPKRGVVTDRNGDELAISLDAGSIYAHPHLIKNKHSAAKKIANLTGLSYQRVLKKISDKTKRFVWIKRLAPIEQTEKLSKRKIKGIGIIKEAKRFYPNGQLAAHLLGFVGTDGNGLEGVELAFDQYLTGPPTFLRLSQDALGRPISIDERYFKAPPQGHTVELTIDKNLQYQLEKVLLETVKENEAEGGMGIMMAPFSGEILAMVSTPGYDPNKFNSVPPSRRRNRVITDVFEPGSIFKVFVAAAALETGVTTTETKVFCENGKYQVDDIVIGEAIGHKYEWLTIPEVIKYSSNIGSVKIAEMLGRDRLFDAVRDFGFGQKSGIDLPGETRGIVQPRDQWSNVATSTISFGQGIGISVIQIARALSAIANGGSLVRPFIVRRVIDKSGNIVEEQLPQVGRRVISDKTAKKIKEMMISVTESGGTGELAAIPGFVVAGKTGTAQKPDPESGGYYEDRYISAFVGFVPANKPRFVLTVLIDDPRKQHYGGQVSAPAFRQISERALRVLKIPPAGTTIRRAIADTSPTWEGRKLPAFKLTKKSVGLMPDLVGLTAREVFQVFGTFGIVVNVTGSGFVFKQSPPPGAEFKLSKGVRVELKQNL
ncbi:penicillin-binding protein [Bdellovibrionota bacterium]